MEALISIDDLRANGDPIYLIRKDSLGNVSSSWCHSSEIAIIVNDYGNPYVKVTKGKKNYLFPVTKLINPLFEHFIDVTVTSYLSSKPIDPIGKVIDPKPRYLRLMKLDVKGSLLLNLEIKEAHFHKGLIEIVAIHGDTERVFFIDSRKFCKESAKKTVMVKDTNLIKKR